MVPGAGPLNVRLPSGSPLVSVTVAEASNGLSLSMTETSASTTATAGPPSVNRVRIVCARRRRIVGVEIERRREVRRRENDVHVGRGDIAVGGTVVDGDPDDAVSSGNARGVEGHLLQGRLIGRARGRAAEREDASEGI